MRTLPLLAMAALLCLLFLLSFASSGIIRQPGDDEDAGSGFGGTGRDLVPGSESGLGGTGVRPYLGFEAQSSSAGSPRVPEVRAFLNPEPGITPLLTTIDVPADTLQPMLELPLPRTIETVVHDPYSEGAGSIHITEAIQWDLDNSALTLNSDSLNEPITRSNSQLPANDQPADDNLPGIQAETETSRTEINWTTLTATLQQTNDNEQMLDADVNDEDPVAEKVNRPSSIQRPVLPHLQRARPVQRAGLLPPPIRPLRL